MLDFQMMRPNRNNFQPNSDAMSEKKTEKQMLKVKKDPKLDAESEKKTQNLMLKMKKRPKS